MALDRTALLAALAEEQPSLQVTAPVSVAALVSEWLRTDASAAPHDRIALEALCRQIDVRKRVSVGYDEGFAKVDPEEPAPAAVVAGLVGVLLATADDHTGDIGSGEVNSGWGLKCINSALKALELDTSPLPHHAELTGWAFEALDRAAVPGEVTA